MADPLQPKKDKIMKFTMILLVVFSSLLILALRMTENKQGLKSEISAVKTPPAEGENSFYVSNRSPLLPAPLVKLPIGNIRPKGWLLSQLQLMRDGFTGHLPELSKFLKEDSAWLTLEGRGWEEMPYWLKGFGDLGYILKDKGLITEAKKWIDAALSTQQADGYFGPPENKKNHDSWPNMIMLFVLQSLYEATGDERVIPFMTRYFRYQSDLPEEHLLPGSWQKLRGGDNLESVYWLYNRTGNEFLLALNERIFRRTSDWTSPVLTPERDKNWEPSSFYHGVNISMGLRQPGVYYQQSKDIKHIDAVEQNYRMIMDAYGQQPGGMFGADENIRPAHTDPRYAAETCSMVEFMYSNQSLLKITGDTRYAERCEDIAFNSFPASMTPDLKALHYLTAPNLISCDSTGEHDFQNSGTLLSYDPWRYRCCQHNVAFGWPYYAEHLWMATLDNGLAALLYSASEVSAKVGDGIVIRISEDTDYPFNGVIDFTIWTEHSVEFPFYLRIPAWCEKARISINGQPSELQLEPGCYAVLHQRWRNADQIRLELPMDIEIKTWEKINGAVSVKRGPLWYSLEIAEKWNRYGGTDRWPAYEILPSSPWNYGLMIDPKNPADSIRLADQKIPAYQPFMPENAPIILKAKAKMIPFWQAEGKMAGKVPPSPVSSDLSIEEITLIPMGCARLRISVFPQIKNP
jgi:hypothetical protein